MAGQACDEAESHPLIRGLLRRHAVLQHGRKPVRDGTGGRKQDDRGKATHAVTVGRCNQAPLAHHDKIT
jgi:hypothetical protein